VRIADPAVSELPDSPYSEAVQPLARASRQVSCQDAAVPDRPSRRGFLRRTSLAALGLPVLGGCPTDEPGPTDELPMSKLPWVQLVEPGRLRVRFETRQDRALPVRLGEGPWVTPTTDPRELEYAWGLWDVAGLLPDEPGLHVVQEALFDLPAPGQPVQWTVQTSPTTFMTGSFVPPPAPGGPFRFGFLADTMRPNTDDAANRLAGESPDLVLHGGDFQYQSNPLDTWNSQFDALRPLLSTAMFHVVPGNHEHEGQSEITVMWDRLFGGQGGAPITQRHHAFTWGPVRFLGIDSEESNWLDDESPQLAWIRQELQATEDDADLLFAIPFFHRPYYTLSRYWSSNTSVRDLLHPLFRDHGVPLVLNGHVHAYEHFEVEGVHYVVDGGGGALTYDPVEYADQVEALRPGESALQLAASRTHGVTVIDVAEDGGMSVRRLHAKEDEVVDSFEIPPPA